MSSMSKSIEDLSPEKRELLELLLKKQAVEVPRLKVAPREREGNFPLSYGQKAHWFLQQLEPENAAYNISMAFRILTPPDVPALQRSFQKLVDRHASLRTTFTTIDGEPVQQIHDQLDLSFQQFNAAGWSESELHDFLVKEARRPFNLEQGPLIRISLFSRETEYILLMVQHHIITDLWTQVILTHELGTLYPAERTGAAVSLPPPELQYTDYVLWEADDVGSEAGRRRWEYWQRQLAGELPALNMPADHPRPSTQTYKGASQTIKLSAELTSNLKSIAQAQNATLYTTLLAAYAVLLYRHTSQEDILIGSPTSGRSRPELANVAGYFVNSVVLRANLSGNPTFLEFLSRLRQTVLEAFENQDFPFPLLTERLHPTRDSSRSPVFQTTFVVQKSQMPDQQGLTAFVQAETGAQMEIGGLVVELMPVFKGTSQFDLRMAVAESDDELSVLINYNTDLFDAETITRLLEHFQVLLGSVVSDQGQPISGLQILTQRELNQLLVEWNDTASVYPEEKCIHEVFEAQAHRTPDAIAVDVGNKKMTYRELNARANQLARHLRTLEVGPESLVGICVERSLEMIVTLFGILKAGGAYVSLDPGYPKDRLAFILEDARVRVLVTQQHLLENLPQHDATVVCLDVEAETLNRQNEQDLNTQAKPNSAAYVIYTSGSTGGPKGVVIEHKSTVNLIYWARSLFTDGDLANVFASASINFDCSIFEIFVPLSWGGTVVLAKSALDLPYLSGAQDISLLNTVPSSMTELLRVNGVPESVRTVNLSADLLHRNLVDQVYRQTKAERVFNGYGPTEDTTFTTFGLVERNEVENPPIGRPVANHQVYLLDAYMNPTPIGVPGELYIGGAGLARGYLNRAELTDQKFITNPFSSEPGARLYRSGDLARYLPDGRIEFMGRIDHQVKVRGFRVELSEVEAVLAQHPAVQQTVVLAREDTPGVKRLVAYVVSSVTPAPTTSELRSYAKEKLPQYMVPSLFVMLETLPMTPSGKVDRRALPTPDLTRPELAEEFVAPRNPSEEMLAGIWAQVLEVERVGIFDNFFDLGGDSILSVQVTSRANQAGLPLTTKQLFQHQTVAGLAAVVNLGPLIHAEQGLVTGPVPLTPIQHWFFEQNIPEAHHWNVSILLEIQNALDSSLLEKALTHLLKHHDALRLRFERADGHWTQYNSDASESQVFSVQDLSRMPHQEVEAALVTAVAEVQSSLNLSAGPLLRVTLFELGPEKSQRLLIVLHHLAVDALSWQIFLEDFQIAYEQLKSAGAIHLPLKTSSYKDWAQHLVEYAGSPQLKDELIYWSTRSRQERTPIPLDYPEGINTAASARTISVSLDPEETRILLHRVPSGLHAQINEVLLAALARTFASWTEDSYLLVDLEAHGREDLFDNIDLSRTVGWFTSIYPVELDLAGTSAVSEAILSMSSQFRRIPHKGVGYGVLRYLSVEQEVTATLRALPSAEVSFNYLRQFDQVLSGSSPFRLAREDSGPSRSSTGIRSHLIDITARVTDKQFRASWTYSGNLHKSGTIEHLAQTFIDELKSVIKSAGSDDIRLSSFVAPRTPVEEVVARVWSDVLKTETISANDDFFILGGESSSARQVINQVNEIFGVQLPQQALIEFPTLAAVSSAIDDILLKEIEELTDDDVRQMI